MGRIPWDEAGAAVTVADAVRALAARASYVVAVGTCAAFGGIPAAFCDTGAQGLGAFLDRAVINLSGCPAHPDWIIGALGSLLSGTVPALDNYGRPVAYYTSVTYSQISWRAQSELDHHILRVT
jgi:hydrogenase small subunit